MAVALLMSTLTGCYKAPTPEGKTGDDKSAKADSKHSGWWCEEHGIPEEECSMCSAKVAADFKKKGDWCDKHDRALSQCFVCNPKQQEFYAAKYKAKFGKEPPPLSEPLPKDESSDKGKSKDKTDK
ncbi:MAG: RND transporter [Gemmataceae bacterium]